MTSSWSAAFVTLVCCVMYGMYEAAALKTFNIPVCHILVDISIKPDTQMSFYFCLVITLQLITLTPLDHI